MYMYFLTTSLFLLLSQLKYTTSDIAIAFEFIDGSYDIFMSWAIIWYLVFFFFLNICN